MARLFDNTGSWILRSKDGVDANATLDKGKYFCDTNGDDDWNTTSEYAAMVWGSANVNGAWPKPACVNMKALVQNKVDFNTPFDFGDNETFLNQVDVSMAGVMRDCAECHVGGGANEYLPHSAVGSRTELRGADAQLDSDGTTAFNFFIDQYDENNDGNIGELLEQNYDDTGVLEVDCLMCHMEGYSWDDRTHALREGKFDTSRVVGAGIGIDDFNATTDGGYMGPGYGLKVAYDGSMVESVDGNATLTALANSMIEGVPPSANCSSCHFDMHRVDWKKRGTSWVNDHTNEVHYSLGCMGCHERTDSVDVDPVIGDNDAIWTGAGSSTELGHDPTKGGAPFSSLWNKNDKKGGAKTCAYCHTTNPGTETALFAVDPTDAHTAAGLLATLTQNGRDGVADSTHLDIISCDACHSRKLGNGPETGLGSHGSLYEWGTGGALVDATGPDEEGRLTDHENLYVERTMEENLTRVWRGGKIIAANVLVTMFWRDKDDLTFDANADGQMGGMDAINMEHVRKAMDIAGLAPLTADGNVTATDINDQRTALFNYLTTDINDDNVSDTTGTAIPAGYTAGKLKLCFMGVPFIANHNTSPAANAFGSGGCIDCHADGAGFYNGNYELKGRDLTITLPAGGGHGTPYTKVNSDKAVTNFHPKVFVKGLKERSIPVRIHQGDTMRDIDRSELLYDSRDVTAIALDTDPIDARVMTNGVVAATRAEVVAELNNLASFKPWGDAGSVADMLHDVHLNMETLSHLADPALLTSTVACDDCHGSSNAIKATGTVGTAGIINDDNSFEATVSNYILAGGVLGDEYVTCTTLCHHDGSQDGTVTAEEQGTYVVARLTATNSRTDNRVITFDASESACVDDCTFSPFTFTGCGSIVDELGGNGNDVIVIRDDNATTPCTGSIDVASSYDGGATPVTVAVEITADDSIVPAALVNSIVVTPTNTSEASGSECVQTYSVNLAAVLDADIDYGANVYVYWGDRTRSVVTPVELNGTTHVYDANGTKNIRVRTKDSNWEITDETTSVALSDVACP